MQYDNMYVTYSNLFSDHLLCYNTPTWFIDKISAKQSSMVN